MSFGTDFERAMCSFNAMGGGHLLGADTATVVAYVVRGDTVEFSTAVCAPHDRFNAAVGAAIALERFMEGQTVTMRRADCAFL